MIDCMYIGNISKVNDDIIGLEWTSVSSGFDVKNALYKRAIMLAIEQPSTTQIVPNKQLQYS